MLKKLIFSWMMDNEKGTPGNSVSKTNWHLCAICQEVTSEALEAFSITFTANGEPEEVT